MLAVALCEAIGIISTIFNKPLVLQIQTHVYMSFLIDIGLYVALINQSLCNHESAPAEMVTRQQSSSLGWASAMRLSRS